MTLKYKLIIEGTAIELELPKHLKLQDRLGTANFNVGAGLPMYSGIINQVEYKVVEPLHIELTQYVDIDGQINLRGCGILPRHAGKKVKVVITEEEV